MSDDPTRRRLVDLARAPLRLARLVPAQVGPLELHLFGRTLGSAALVGLLAGLVGAAFVAGVDVAQDLLLNRLAGAALARAAGELGVWPAGPSRPWLILLLPAAGALVSGLVARVYPQVAGGGGDAAIAAVHAGVPTDARLLPAKWVASVAALGTGGAGGREGPALQLGQGVGALVARFLQVDARQRRILYVAGMAAGMAAVFRTPLGAALLAAEILYRDDFDSDAVVPAVIASVVGYATGQVLLGQQPLFGALPPHPFHAAHLPWYAGLAVVAALSGAAFAGALAGVRRVVGALRLPGWAAPLAGGAALGGLVAALHVAGVERLLGVSAASAAMGGGYGIAQLAVTPVAAGWGTAGVLAALALLRTVATGLTVGSGASAGDFAPSLVIGGLVGGAYGQAIAALTGDPRLVPGAFAIVGMGALYGGVAHVPVSAVVIVSELAGSYDLLVPLMLAAVVAHVALGRVRLYHAQRATKAGPGPAGPDQGTT